MKKIVMIASLFILQSAYAENVIYKCTSNTGEVTYQNNAGDRTECSKTNFASFPNINFFKQDLPKSKDLNSGNVASNNMKTTNSIPVVSEEQRIRDSKRALILSQELAQEKEQLNTVSVMLKNLKDSNSKDSAQISQLEELKNSHVNNVTAIERELGNTKIIVNNNELKIEKASLPMPNNNQPMMITKAISPSSNSLPVALPTSIPTTLPLTLKKETVKQIPLTPISNTLKVKPVVETKPIVVEKSKDLSDKAILDDKRKNNKLGTSINYVSGLSGMSKIKN